MNLRSTMSNMRESFVNSKRKIEERNLPLPENEYLARITQCTVKKAKSTELHYIGLGYYILEGEEKGRIAWDNSLYLIPEKTDFILSFFDKFGFDIDEIMNDEDGSVIQTNCELIYKAAPSVRIRIKHWSPEDNPEDIRYNVYLNKVIDDIFDSEDRSDIQQEGEEVQKTESGKLSFLDTLDKKDLKDLIVNDEEGIYDISIKTIVKTSEDDLRDLMKEQYWEFYNSESETESETESGDEDSDNELRLKLLDLCKSQGVEKSDYSKKMSLDELKESLSQYTFYTEGDGALTNDEISLLIDAGLDECINDEGTEEEPPPPPPKKSKGKSSPKPKGRKR